MNILTLLYPAVCHASDSFKRHSTNMSRFIGEYQHLFYVYDINDTIIARKNQLRQATINSYFSFNNQNNKFLLLLLLLFFFLPKAMYLLGLQCRPITSSSYGSLLSVRRDRLYAVYVYINTCAAQHLFFK
jgi:hypothetical protein